MACPDDEMAWGRACRGGSEKEVAEPEDDDDDDGGDGRHPNRTQSGHPA